MPLEGPFLRHLVSELPLEGYSNEQEDERREKGKEGEVGKWGRKRKRPDGERDKTEGKETQFVTGLPLTNMAGHTGYLTFATLPAKKITN